jgi:hypothetical protein
VSVQSHGGTPASTSARRGGGARVEGDGAHQREAASELPNLRLLEQLKDEMRKRLNNL